MERSADEPVLSNADIANRLASLAQLLSTQKENPYKVRAYQRAAAKVRTLSESIDELVRDGSDLTEYAGIGEAIGSAIREIVLTGTLGKLEKLRSQASPELASISAHPRLDPKRILRIYKKLNISSVEALREQLENGEIEKKLGLRMSQHVRQGLTETHAMLLYKADDLRVAVEEFLIGKCGVSQAEVAGDYRRRVEVIEEMVFCHSDRRLSCGRLEARTLWRPDTAPRFVEGFRSVCSFVRHSAAGSACHKEGLGCDTDRLYRLETASTEAHRRHWQPEGPQVRRFLSD